MLSKTCARKKLTRKEERDLEIEIGFMEGIIRRDPSFVEAYQVLTGDYARRGDVANGLRIARELAALRPHDPIALYNFACSLSLSRQLRRAADTLNLAIQRGYRNFKLLLRDPDLANLRRHPVFRRVQEQLRALELSIR